jgi:deoxyadenosine/deoxycytidine kinase
MINIPGCSERTNFKFIDMFASKAKVYQGGSHYLQIFFLKKRKKNVYKNTNTKKYNQ